MYSARTAHSICIYVHTYTHISPRTDSSVVKFYNIHIYIYLYTYMYGYTYVQRANCALYLYIRTHVHTY